MSQHFQKLSAHATIVPDAEALAAVTAHLLVKAFTRILAQQDRLTFLPSSGRTPLKTYQILGRTYRDALDWSRISLVQMDEYWTDQLDPDAYFHHFLDTHLVAPLGLTSFLSIRGSGTEAPGQYARKIEQVGPIDFALHGIGRNGHIGFNEPGTRKNAGTRIVELAPATRADNFADLTTEQRPHYGITLGLKELCDVRHTLLIATGAHKAPAIRGLLNRDPISEIPACALWDSPDFGLIIDRDAARLVVDF